MFLSLVLWLLLGWVTSYYAQQRGRDPLIWFLVGMFLGLIGLLLLFILPSVTNDKEKENSSLDEQDELKEGISQTIEIQPEFIQKQPEYAISQWYYLDKERQQQGPVEFEELKKIWVDHQIDFLTYVWHEGMENWKKIEELPDLYNGLKV